MTHHDGLRGMEGENLSKNARLQLVIAESVYYLSLENVNKLVVLVTNQQNLREEVENLAQDNLVSLTLAQFTQWLRTKQKPINVSQKMASFSNGKISHTEESSSVKTNVNSNGKTASINAQSYQPKARIKPKNNTFNTILSGFLAIGGFSITIMLAWYLIQPKSFQQFWQKTDLPSLSK
jgi:hypothetical protein